MGEIRDSISNISLNVGSSVSRWQTRIKAGGIALIVIILLFLTLYCTCKCRSSSKRLREKSKTRKAYEKISYSLSKLKNKDECISDGEATEKTKGKKGKQKNIRNEMIELEPLNLELFNKYNKHWF